MRKILIIGCGAISAGLIGALINGAEGIVVIKKDPITVEVEELRFDEYLAGRLLTDFNDIDLLLFEDDSFDPIASRFYTDNLEDSYVVRFDIDPG